AAASNSAISQRVVDPKVVAELLPSHKLVLAVAANDFNHGIWNTALNSAGSGVRPVLTSCPVRSPYSIRFRTYQGVDGTDEIKTKRMPSRHGSRLRRQQNRTAPKANGTIARKYPLVNNPAANVPASAIASVR